jgi:hypothetical protein
VKKDKKKINNDLARLFYYAKSVGEVADMITNGPTVKEVNERINSYNTGNNFT